MSENVEYGDHAELNMFEPGVRLLKEAKSDRATAVVGQIGDCLGAGIEVEFTVGNQPADSNPQGKNSSLRKQASSCSDTHEQLRRCARTLAKATDGSGGGQVRSDPGWSGDAWGGHSSSGEIFTNLATHIQEFQEMSPVVKKDRFLFSPLYHHEEEEEDDDDLLAQLEDDTLTLDEPVDFFCLGTGEQSLIVGESENDAHTIEQQFQASEPDDVIPERRETPEISHQSNQVASDHTEEPQVYEETSELCDEHPVIFYSERTSSEADIDYCQVVPFVVKRDSEPED